LSAGRRLEPSSDIRRVVEHGHDQRRCCRVGDPVTPGLGPKPSGPGQHRIGPWCWQTRIEIGCDRLDCLIERGQKITASLRAAKTLIMFEKRQKLALRLAAEPDHAGR